ncbi:MAG: DUF3987 domain-containing protein, partial [Planctomycetota bacterium]|nr:DUF3987 domain-containing protein [Planctomycetota bacterium]
LDCDESVELAPEYLPPGGIFTGREGRPGSHVFYECRGARSRPFKDMLIEDKKKSTTIELRSTGCQTVVGPSIHPDGSRYDRLEGELVEVNADVLEAAVESIHLAILRKRGHEEQVVSGSSPRERPASSDDQTVDRESFRPGDDFNRRGDLRRFLERHGWQLSYRDGNQEHYTRPGKNRQDGHSATFNGTTFYLFSSSVAGLEPDTAYSPFQLYAALEHGGDLHRAASALAEQGFGSRRDIVPESEADWPEPQDLPDELLPVESFDAELLPESLRLWITDIAERLQCPMDFPAVAAMVALAGIVGRTIGIRPQRRTPWMVVPNLWGAVIGRPGLMKTPALSEPLRVMRQLEAKAKVNFEDAEKEHKVSVLIAAATKKVLEKQLAAAIKANEGAEAIAQKMESVDIPAPHRKRHLVNDCTVEKLGELLNENPNGLTLFRDELTGFLKSLDKAGAEGSRAFYLEAWNGAGHFTYDRIGRGTVDILAAIVSMIGGFQPGPLGEYLRKQAAGGGGDDGLVQRLQLAVWPDCPKSWQNVDRWPNSESKEEAYSVFERLDGVEPLFLGAEYETGEDVPFLRFSEPAQELFDGWRSEVEKKVRSGNDHPAIESHLAKYRSLIPTLALLVHLADEPTGGPVSETALKRAIGWARYLETHARRIYASVTQPSIGAAHRLAAKIKNGSVSDRFTLRDVYRKNWSGLTDRKEVAAAVDVLIDHDVLRSEDIRTNGRSSTTYHINPRFHSNEI